MMIVDLPPGTRLRPTADRQGSMVVVDGAEAVPVVGATARSLEVRLAGEDWEIEPDVGSRLYVGFE